MFRVKGSLADEFKTAKYEALEDINFARAMNVAETHVNTKETGVPIDARIKKTTKGAATTLAPGKSGCRYPIECEFNRKTTPNFKITKPFHD